MFLTTSIGERRKQSHCLTVYLANWLKHGAAGSPARWKQHVNQTILRNRGIMIFQNLKTHCFTFIISTPCVVVHLFQITIFKKKIVLFPMIVGGDNFMAPPVPPGISAYAHTSHTHTQGWLQSPHIKHTPSLSLWLKSISKARCTTLVRFVCKHGRGSGKESVWDPE